MRILIALEHPGMSHFLTSMVQEKNGVVIVGQADNVTKTLTLARKLRPDIAIIDCYLPYSIGLDGVPLSRSGGLDAAQVISEEIPNARVMVLNNLQDIKLPETWANSDTVVSFARETISASVPLDLREFSNEPGNGPVFAQIEFKRKVDIKQRGKAISDDVCLFGGFVVLSGLIMMLTLILMVPGIIVASVGLLMVVTGFLAKLMITKFLKEGRK